MPISDQQLICNLQSVQEQIKTCQKECQSTQVVDLLAVSKTHPSAAVRALYHAGQRAFGENYLQEALPKIQELKDLPELSWHFIGQIQSNKTAQIAAHFDWVQSVSRLKIAKRLSAQRPRDLPPLNILLQVDVDNSSIGSKAGVLLEDAAATAKACSQLEHIRLRGLMCIPDLTDDFASQRATFAKLTALFNTLNAAGMALDTLSMGMSADMRAAISAGSTMVRVGTAIFGARQ